MGTLVGYLCFAHGILCLASKATPSISFIRPYRPLLVLMLLVLMLLVLMLVVAERITC